MILHLFSYEKFTSDYIKRINQLFNPNDHLFFVIGDKVEKLIDDPAGPNVIYSSQYNGKIDCMLDILKKIAKSDLIIFHSMFFGSEALLLLIIEQIVLKKNFFWNIWGFDLYNEYRNRKKCRVHFKLMQIFIRHLKGVGYIKGDYNFLKDNFKTNANFYIASYTYDFSKLTFKPSDPDNIGRNIMLGNSATEECKYEMSIDFLQNKVRDCDKVFCILSYPHNNVDYRSKIIKYGNDKLGNKFIPIVDYMNFKEYASFLENIDIAIFNQNRQQGLGNIAELIYLGKKVYVNPQNACLEYFEDIDVNIYSTKCMDKEDFFKLMPVSDAVENNRKIGEFYSDANFYHRWNEIFNSYK